MMLVFLRRHLRLATVFAASSLSTQMEYRANFIAYLIEAVLRGAGAILGLSVLYGDGRGLGGWSHAEALVLVGVSTLVGGLVNFVVLPNMRRISEAVRTGALDFVLLKPVDSQFFVSTREINLMSLSESLIGLGFIVYGFAERKSFAWPNIVLAFFLLLAAMMIVYAICLMLSTIAFWFVRVENTLELFWGFYEASRFPIQAYPGWVRFLFSFIVPVAFISTVPSEALVGRANLGSVVSAVVVAVLLFAFSRWFWRFGLSNYTSASS